MRSSSKRAKLLATRVLSGSLRNLKSSKQLDDETPEQIFREVPMAGDLDGQTREEFTEDVLESMKENEQQRFVFFNNVSLCTGSKKKQPMRLAIFLKGVCGIPQRGDDQLIFFHGWTAIKNFVTPEKATDGSMSAEDPAGYVVTHDRAESQYMFHFSTMQERGLFINILMRYASLFVDEQMRKAREREQLKRQKEDEWVDRAASPGLKNDSPMAVVEHIRQRRMRENIDSDTRRALRFKREEEVIQQSLHAVRQRAYTK